MKREKKASDIRSTVKKILELDIDKYRKETFQIELKFKIRHLKTSLEYKQAENNFLENYANKLLNILENKSSQTITVNNHIEQNIKIKDYFENLKENFEL